MLTQTLKIIAASVAITFASAGSAVAAYCSGSGGAAPLATSDVTFNSTASNDCYGVVDLTNQDPETITNFANTTGLWTPDPWSFITRDDSISGSSLIGSFGGYSFSIAADNSSNNGTWLLTVTGTPMPFMMDFLVYLHAGSNSAYYFFDDRTINTANTGAFTIAFTAGNGNSTSNPGLSGLTILGRDISRDVPEPISLALLGIGLLGLGTARRLGAKSA